MAPPQWTTSVLLASLILVLCSASAWSDSSANPSALARFKRGQITPEIRTKIDKGFDVVVTSLRAFKDVMTHVDPDQVATVMSALGSFAALAPGIGTAFAATISLILLFIPTEDKVMNEFAEVNNKLDSISMQISQLKTDVKVSSFLSAYTTNEATIVNAWKEFEKFKKKPTDDDKENNINIKNFIKYYKDTNVRKEVDNLFYFLTVEGVSISENINNLYKEKFECHVKYMGIYSLYLNDLMLKGMILNQVYLQLTHQSSPDDHTQRVNNLKKLYEIQKNTLRECYDSYEEQMEKDVEKIAKSFKPEEKKDIAEKVKTHLDDKYSWYDWLVVVYNTEDEKKHKIHNMIKIIANTVTVAVTYTLKVSPAEEEIVKQEISTISQKCDVEQLKDYTITLSSPGSGHERFVDLTEYVMIGEVMNRHKDVAELPEPLRIITCKNKWHKSVALHYSRKVEVCKPNPCQNGGVCKRLLESNNFLCECQDSFWGDLCENKVDTDQIREMLKDIPDTVPVPERQPPKATNSQGGGMGGKPPKATNSQGARKSG
ncbi:uncharacterized protein LOC133422030 [Cololabis saira]|uniref:uncharacterized protein LOC133422030 n=1 Tax=Cololabis saira TaxID=129043 RepID=UPI002AD5AC73|nr:uncharacterized protein LOC133422030 [Cololabis saira]